MNAPTFADFVSDLDDFVTPADEAANALEVAGLDHTAPATYFEKCAKCNGTGRVIIGYAYRRSATCFACQGRGGWERKTSPEARAKARASAEVRKAKNEASNWSDFAEREPAVAAWIESSPDFEFAVSLGDAVRKYGDLSDKQLAAANKCVEARKARDERRAAAALEREASAPAVTTDKVRAAFDAAIGRGIKYPRLRLGSFVFKPAGASSKNPGAIYAVRKSDDAYLGKVVDGKFYASRDCDETTRGEVAVAINDPEAAAIAYGKRFGQCAICGRELSNEASIERGIGPICAETFGW